MYVLQNTKGAQPIVRKKRKKEEHSGKKYILTVKGQWVENGP